MRESANKSVEVWAVASGKGGTGKSFFVSQIGKSLASRGHRVLVIDLDISGANLHNFLSLPRMQPGIDEYFRHQAGLNQLIRNSKTNNLFYIPGCFSGHGAEIRSAMPEDSSFINRLRETDFEYILLDLGCGLSKGSISLYLESDLSIAITSPEVPALENFFSFLKTLYFFKINRWLEKGGQKTNAIELWEKRNKKKIADFNEFRNHLCSEVLPSQNNKYPELSFSLVLNKLRTPDEIHHGFSLRCLSRKHLDCKLDYSGYIEYQDNFWKTLKACQGIPVFKPKPRISQELKNLTRNLLNRKEIELENHHNG